LASRRPSLSELFFTFLRIGAMGFGGTFALVSLQERVVVEKGWMTTEEFAESTGMAGMAPGPISSNTAAVVGYRLGGLAGAGATYVSFHLPAVVLVIVIATYLGAAEQAPMVKGALKGVFAAVVGLLVAVGWKMGRALIRDWKTAALALAAFLALVLLNANPVLIVLGAGALGFLAFRPAGGERK
jgi:chromate transporter